MNYKSIKLASESPLPIELVKHDNQIRAVVIGDLRIEGDYGIKVLVAQPFEKVKRHRITATIEGFGKKVEYFENRWDGDSRAHEFQESGATVEREDIDVLVDERGVVQSAMLAADDDSDRIPF